MSLCVFKEGSHRRLWARAIWIMSVPGLLAACSTLPEKPKTSLAAPTQKPAAVSRPQPAAEKSALPEYLGLQVPPMPEGHESTLGYLLEPESGKYSVEVISYGSKKMVWLGRFTHHDPDGRAHWTIVAVLPPRQLPSGYIFSGGNCTQNGRPQPELVAVMKMEDKETLTQIQNAWRANPQEERFEELPPQGIQCINEGWGHL